jgi:hypothetical protein
MYTLLDNTTSEPRGWPQAAHHSPSATPWGEIQRGLRRTIAPADDTHYVSAKAFQWRDSYQQILKPLHGKRRTHTRRTSFEIVFYTYI